MRRQKVEQKDVVIPYCEGEAEILLFGFLKHQYSNKNIEFRPATDLGGLSDLAVFKRKYNKVVKKLGCTPAKDYGKVRLLFIIDNDLTDSYEIKNFLKGEGRLLQLCDPNTEGMILNIIGKPQAKTVGDKDYRKKCKNAFENHFGCKAHRLKETQLKEIFSSEEVFKNRLPVLHNLFKK